MSLDETSTTTPQYIVTTPGDGGDDDDDDGDNTTTTTIIEQSSPNTIINTSTSTSNNKIITKTISLSTRSQSLQSSTSSSASIVDHTSVVNALMEQLKAQSSANIGNVSEKHFKTITSSTSSSSSSAAAASVLATSSKGKFQSFLQNPDTTSGSVSHTTSTGTFLTAQQKHVRQFVRSSSAHSTESAAAITNKSDKTCIRSASTQIDGTANEQGILSSMEQHQSVMATKGLQQTSTILISKSAETIEAKTSTSAGMRTQLTLSGGFLAPPNRKLTILSPVHAPPGLHDMLKRHGRSPLSPRISFPGGDTDLFQ